MQEVIMTDIDELTQEFWRTSSDEVVGASFAMRCFHDTLQHCLEVCFVLATAFDLTDENLQVSGKSDFDDRIRDKFKILFDAYRKMLDQSFSKSKNLGVMLNFLPGVVVQKQMSMQGMADLYKIKPDLLEHLVNSTIEPLEPSPSYFILDDYLSRFLQDRDRSQLYYCDPMHQHISICRHFLSLVDGSNASDLQS